MKTILCFTKSSALVALALASSSALAADISLNGVTQYLSGGSANVASTSPNIGSGFGGSQGVANSSRWSASSSASSSSMGLSLPSNGDAAAASNCVDLQNRVQRTAQSYLSSSMPSDGPANANESKGVVDLLTMPSGTDLIADVLVVALEMGLVDRIVSSAQNYINDQVGKLSASFGNPFAGMAPLMPVVKAVVTAAANQQ